MAATTKFALLSFLFLVSLSFLSAPIIHARYPEGATVNARKVIYFISLGFRPCRLHIAKQGFFWLLLRVEDAHDVTRGLEVSRKLRPRKLRPKTSKTKTPFEIQQDASLSVYSEYHMAQK